MYGLKLIRNFRSYLDYLEEHLRNVRRAWAELHDKCIGMQFIYDDYLYDKIKGEVERHDLSKFSEFEFVQYRKAFYPEELEGEVDISQAWNHHKTKNPHHWENWTKEKYLNSCDWKIHCVHMVIDWMAMSYTIPGDSAQKFYEENSDKIKLPDYAIDFIYEIFKRIKVDAGVYPYV